MPVPAACRTVTVRRVRAAGPRVEADRPGEAQAADRVDLDHPYRITAFGIACAVTTVTFKLGSQEACRPSPEENECAIRKYDGNHLLHADELARHIWFANLVDCSTLAL